MICSFYKCYDTLHTLSSIVSTSGLYKLFDPKCVNAKHLFAQQFASIPRFKYFSVHYEININNFLLWFRNLESNQMIFSLSLWFDCSILLRKKRKLEIL